MKEWIHKHISLKDLKTALLAAGIIAISGFLWGKLSDGTVGTWLDNQFTAVWHWTLATVGRIQSWLTTDATVTRWEFFLWLATAIALYFVVSNGYRTFKSLPALRTKFNWLRALDIYFAVMFGQGIVVSTERGKIQFQYSPVLEPKPKAEPEISEKLEYQLSERALLIIEALATEDWPDNEASAQYLAAHMKANMNTVQLALNELLENDYVHDIWHSDDRWFTLTPKGQACALSYALIDDLKYPQPIQND